MIDDPNHPLVRALEGTKAEVVYLPPNVPKGTAPMQSAVKSVDPKNRLAAETYFASGESLHGDTVPAIAVDNEKPIHRMMIYMHAQGASCKDIAKQTGYTYTFVTQLLKQPWARLRLVELIKEAGGDAVKHFLSHEVAPSLETLKEVRDSAASSAQARISASNSILDRALGKPTVFVESESTNRNVPADMQRIEADLAAVRSQLESKGVDVRSSN